VEADMTEAGVTGGDEIYRRSGGASSVLTTWRPRKGGRVDKFIRVGQIVVVVVLLVWLGQYIRDEFSKGMGPLDAVAQAVAGTASFAQTVFDAMTDDLRLRSRDDGKRAHSGPQPLLVELDPTLSKAARGRVAGAFATVWPDLLRPGDTFLIHHRYERGRDAAVWAQRTDEKTLRGSGDGLAAYVEAANVKEPAVAAPVPVPPPAPATDGDAGPPTAQDETAPTPAHEPAPAPVVAPGTAGSIVRNLSGDIVGFTQASRIKLLAITEDVPHDTAVQALMADGYKHIDEVGDDVLMGVDLRRDMAERLEGTGSALAPVLQGLLAVVVPVLLLLCVLLGAKGTRWSLTVKSKRDAPVLFLKVLYKRLSAIKEEQAAPLVDETALWMWRLFVYVFLSWVVLVLVAGGVPTGVVWLPLFVLLGCAVTWIRLRRDQRAIVAALARSMQLHDFNEEMVGEFARSNAELINEGAERVVEPYFSLGGASAHVANERLLSLWSDVMGRDPHELATTLDKQREATLSLLREANTVGPERINDDGVVKKDEGSPKVPDAGPAFGMIAKGYRGSAAAKSSEGGEDGDAKTRPALVKLVLAASGAIHTWLDERMLASKAKRLANAVVKRRLLGESLQDARTMGQDLEARAIARTLERAALDAQLAELTAKKREMRRKARQGDAQAEEDFDHDYEDDEVDEDPGADDTGSDDTAGDADGDAPDGGGDGEDEGDSANDDAPDRP